MTKYSAFGKTIATLKWIGIGMVGVAIGAISFSFGVQSAFSGFLHEPDLIQAPTPDGMMSQSISEKEQLAARMEAAQSLEFDERARKDARVAPGLPASVSPAFREGIFFGESGPFYSGEVLIQNLWQRKEAGQFLQVFAGAYTDDPSQGVLILLVTAADRTIGEATWFRSPEKSGTIQILEQQDEVLIVGNDGGARFFFNLSQKEFVASP